MSENNIDNKIESMFGRITEKLPFHLRKEFKETIKNNEGFQAFWKLMDIIQFKLTVIIPNLDDQNFKIFPAQLKFSDELIIIKKLSGEIEFKYSLKSIKKIVLEPI